MATLKGIDISKWQGNIDFSKVKSDVDFVIIKVTEGFGFTDPLFKTNQTNARKAGLLVGYYCFSRPDLGNTVEQEVDYLLDVIGDLKDGEIICLDYEVSYSKPVSWCKSWLDYLSVKLNGYKGLVYLNQSLLKNNDWTSLIESDYGLWLAIYDYNPDTPMPDTDWGTVAIKQYSNKETVSGINCAVDGNIFYGDKEAYIKYGYSDIPEISDCEQKLSDMRDSRNKWKSRFNKMKKHIQKVLGVTDDDEDGTKSMEAVTDIKKDYDDAVNTVTKLGEAFETEKKVWETVKKGLDTQIEELSRDNSELVTTNKLLESDKEKLLKEYNENAGLLLKGMIKKSWFSIKDKISDLFSSFS